MKIFEVPDFRTNRAVYLGMAVLFAALLAIIATGCASAPPQDETAKNLDCMAARILDQRCQVGIELDPDRCLYAATIARACDLADAPSLLASTPGSGYNPRTLATSWRDTPGGPERFGRGDLSADPWALACSGKVGSALAACLRSRFLESTPAVCAEYARAFGVSTCGTPAGGWTRGPSNERWGSALQALNYFCENDPAVIGSTGRAGGWDCESTAVEWARLGAFGGEAIVTEWLRRTEALPPVLCPNGRIDPGETCRTCPADAGACPPPPPPPDPRLDCSGLTIPPPGAPQFVGKRQAGTDSTGLAAYELIECRGGSLPTPEPPRPALSETTRATLAAVCGWIRSDQPTRRRKCAAAVSEVLGIDASSASIALDAGKAAGEERGILSDLECARLRAEAAAVGDPAPSCGEVAP